MKPILGLVLAIALVVPLGAGLLVVFVFERASDQVVSELGGVDAALVDAVLLVRAVECDTGGIVSGTAFAATVDGASVLVTNRHVVAGAGTVGLQRLDGSTGPRVRSWRLARTADVAVLELEGDAGLKALPLADASPAVGTTVRTVGFPHALPYTTVGPVGAASGSQLLLDLEVEPGASGSPVVDDAGEVVGQIYARRTDGSGVATAVEALAQALAALDEPVSACD